MKFSHKERSNILLLSVWRRFWDTFKAGPYAWWGYMRAVYMTEWGKIIFYWFVKLFVFPILIIPLRGFPKAEREKIYARSFWLPFLSSGFLEHRFLDSSMFPGYKMEIDFIHYFLIDVGSHLFENNPGDTHDFERRDYVRKLWKQRSTFLYLKEFFLKFLQSTLFQKFLTAAYFIILPFYFIVYALYVLGYAIKCTVSILFGNFLSSIFYLYIFAAWFRFNVARSLLQHSQLLAQLVDLCLSVVTAVIWGTLAAVGASILFTPIISLAYALFTTEFIIFFGSTWVPLVFLSLFSATWRKVFDEIADYLLCLTYYFYQFLVLGHLMWFYDFHETDQMMMMEQHQWDHEQRALKYYVASYPLYLILRLFWV